MTQGLEPHELEEFFESNAVSFGRRGPAETRAWYSAHLARDRVITSREQGNIVGAAGSDPSIMTVPGLDRLPTALVVGVTVQPTHRRQGRLTALMRRQLDDLHENREPLAVLFASEGGIYGRFGYEMATFGTRYEIDKRTSRISDGALGAVDGRVRLVDREEARASFAAVFAAYAPKRPGEIDRNEFGAATPLGEPGEDLRNRFFALYEREDKVEGYVAYEIARSAEAHDVGGSRHVLLHDMCHLSDGAYVGLWQFLLGIDLAGEIRTRGRPVDEELRWLLTDHRQLRATRTTDRTWLRLVDVEAALRGRRYARPGDIVIEVRDAFCPWNSACYSLHVDEEWGTPVVERTEREPQLAIDVSALAGVYLGGTPLSSFRIGRQVVEKAEGALQRAELMLLSDRPPFCSTNF